MSESEHFEVEIHDGPGKDEIFSVHLLKKFESSRALVTVLSSLEELQELYQLFGEVLEKEKE